MRNKLAVRSPAYYGLFGAQASRPSLIKSLSLKKAAQSKRQQ